MTKEKDSTIESNTESKRFQPWANLRFAIGATENPEFVLIYDELIELLKYWVEQSLEAELWVLVDGGAANGELKNLPFIRMRINQILVLLPKNDAKAAMDEAVAKCKKDCGFSDEEWDIFRNGTSEQELELQEKLWAREKQKKANQT